MRQAPVTPSHQLQEPQQPQPVAEPIQNDQDDRNEVEQPEDVEEPREVERGWIIPHRPYVRGTQGVERRGNRSGIGIIIDVNGGNGGIRPVLLPRRQ